MKRIQQLFILLFALVVLLPAMFFNFEPQSVSEIDNRVLTANPFQEFGRGFTDQAEDYVSDRIGFRNDLIYVHTMIHKNLFNEVSHPNYIMGQKGYVYGTEAVTQVTYGDYHIAFADMVKKIQTYCEERNVPFLFVFNPSKSAVYSEYLPVGVNPDRSWVASFFSALEERGVRYLDNTQTLLQQKQKGIAVFNQKYDSNHWNDWGAYYGTNAILSSLQQQGMNVYVNQLEDLTVSDQRQTRLVNSLYPISETTPLLSLDYTYETRTDAFQEELAIHPSHRSFSYFVNQTRIQQGAPRALVFQGSYLNNQTKFLLNGFGEYIYVHDYENVINFPYYYQIFQPDCVVFEVAEYTINQGYFNYDAMCQADFNQPLLLEKEKGFSSAHQPLDTAKLTVEQGKTLTTITYAAPQETERAWLCLQQEYDMTKKEEGFSVTVPTEIYLQQKHLLSITLKTETQLLTCQ